MENIIEIVRVLDNKGEPHVICFRQTDSSFIVWRVDNNGNYYSGEYDLSSQEAVEVLEQRTSMKLDVLNELEELAV